MDAETTPRRRVPKVWFTLLVLAAAAVVFPAGLWLYLTHAPTLRRPGLGLDAPGAWAASNPQDVLVSLRWNCAFVVGYGAALLLGTQAARWSFWTPRACEVARLGRCATWTAVTMALVENGCLALAAHRPVPSASGWATAAAVFATVKWASLVPAVLVAVLGLLVTLSRIFWVAQREADDGLRRFGWVRRHRRPRAVAWLREGAVVRPVPRELRLPEPRYPRRRRDSLAVTRWFRRAVDNVSFEWPTPPDPDGGPPVPEPVAGPATGRAAGRPGDQAADEAAEHPDEQRWARAYNVPSVDGRELLDPARRAVGFCLSGGGIRSASLALGALQPLRRQLVQARYLISISGGGYTAGALAQVLTGAAADLDDQYPRGAAPGHRAVHDPEHAYTAGTVELDHIRRHSSYLGSTASETGVALGILARGMIATLLLLFLPAVVLGVAAAWYLHAIPVVTLPTFDGPGHGSGLVPQPVWYALLACWGAAMLWWLAQSILINGDTERWQRRAASARRLARLATHIGVVLALLTVGLVAAARFAYWLGDHVDNGVRFGVSTSLGTVLLTYAAGLASIVWRRRRTIRNAATAARGTPGRRKVAVPQGLLQMLLVALSLGVLAVAWVLLFGISAVWSATTIQVADARWTTWIVAGAAAGFVALFGGFFDESSMSLHPFYRRRIATAFATRVVQRGTGPNPTRYAEAYPPEEATNLSAYGRVAPDAGPFPELVFACTANLTGEDRTPPGFTAASFTMGADWVGGPDVGWVRTAALEELVPKRLRRDLTVQGAVAISAAAVASSMGRMSRWYQVLLALTGARLGAWLPNPTFVSALRTARCGGGTVKDWTLPRIPGTRRMTYLLRELLNIHPAEERLLHVTDGGHYENLGIVEALRRRCTTIYCVDGGGDLPPTAQGLAQAIALAHSELGVTVELDDPLSAEPGSGHLDGATPALAGLASALVGSPVITGTFTYPAASGLPADRRTGRLVVGRALLWADLPYPLLSYAVQSPTFPHDSTSDQWFSDDQFTAYTELGRNVGRLMAAADVSVPAGRSRPGHKRGTNLFPLKASNRRAAAR